MIKRLVVSSVKFAASFQCHTYEYMYHSDTGPASQAVAKVCTHATRFGSFRIGA
jgi:hypothetical protein